MLSALGELLPMAEGAIYGFFLVFLRVSATAALLPGFGERSVPARVRLGLAFAFSVLVWPLVSLGGLEVPDRQLDVIGAMLIEIGIGLAFGLSIRLLILALQLTGSIAAQSTSLAQIMGAGATPDPMPAIGNVLVLAGLALALAGDLHVKAVFALARSYELFPIGLVPPAGNTAQWGVAHAASAFALAFNMAAPFVVASVAYNLTLGVINRAMPQLMVAFVGAPAITAGGIAILAIGAPIILVVWTGHLDHVLGNPFGAPK